MDYKRLGKAPWKPKVTNEGNYVNYKLLFKNTINITCKVLVIQKCQMCYNKGSKSSKFQTMWFRLKHCNKKSKTDARDTTSPMNIMTQASQTSARKYPKRLKVA